MWVFFSLPFEPMTDVTPLDLPLGTQSTRFRVFPLRHSQPLQAAIALAESGLPYQKFEIDLKNKPEWYAPKVNPASKVRIPSTPLPVSHLLQVPAIAYGGPDVPADQPSPESVKLAESGVLIQFIADLAPEGRLLPKDPVEKAKARFFIETFSAVFSPAWKGVVYDGLHNPTELLPALEKIQALLPEKGYAVGQWSIADAAVTPFFARLEVYLSNDLGRAQEGQAASAWKTLQTDPKFSRFRQYFADLKSRESFKETFDTVRNSLGRSIHADTTGNSELHHHGI